MARSSLGTRVKGVAPSPCAYHAVAMDLSVRALGKTVVQKPKSVCMARGARECQSAAPARRGAVHIQRELVLP
jgi:hypothetical protein